MYKYTLRVSVQLTPAAAGQYRFVDFELVVKSDQQFSCEQLFAQAEPIAQKRWPDFLKIQNIKISREEVVQIGAIKPEKKPTNGQP